MQFDYRRSLPETSLVCALLDLETCPRILQVRRRDATDQTHANNYRRRTGEGQAFELGLFSLKEWQRFGSETARAFMATAAKLHSHCG